MEWEAFGRFKTVNDKYLPFQGQGETMATQVATAVNKLVYKWYNDGDVYDNVHSPMVGWGNDLSSYANWLAEYADAGDVLEQIYDCYTEGQYETILWELACGWLDEERLGAWNEKPAVGSVYDCDGCFEWSEGGEDGEY